MVVVLPQGARADVPAVRSAVEAAVRDIERLDQVALVTSPYAENVKNAVSAGGRAAIIAVPLDVPQAETTPATKQRLQDIGAGLERRIGAGATVHVGGDAFSNAVPKLSPTEGIGLVIAFLVLFLVFRSLVAAAMPMVTAVFGVAVAVALIFAATVLTPISSTAPMLAVMLGLAVGIDYALFILSRHRDQLGEGLEVEESIARATATAGSAVVFAGITVVIALLGLAVAGIPFLTTMGVAAAFSVCVAVAVAVTATPALLAVAGERLRPRPRRRRPGRERVPLSRRWVRLATRSPIVTIVVVVAALGLCALPAADLRLALPNSGTEAPGTPARDTFDAIARHFGPGYNAPLVVSVDVLDTTDPVGVTDKIAAEIERLDGVAAVPVATPNRKGDTAIIQVVPDSPGDSPQTEALVQRLRDRAEHFRRTYGVATAVTGFTAVGIDVSARLAGALLPFGAVVVGLSLVLLAMVFRSIAVPVKAALGYLLSVGAAFGATSFVFQQGHLAQALGVQHTGSVISFLPIILMGVLFGLAMDYEVFLLSRMREEYVHHRDPHRAIESGFVSASTVVVAAAVIMFAVFAAFVPEGSATIKPIAFSLAVGVFVDAFIVRMTLVPAVLALLGHRAWWLARRSRTRRLSALTSSGEPGAGQPARRSSRASPSPSASKTGSRRSSPPVPARPVARRSRGTSTPSYAPISAPNWPGCSPGSRTPARPPQWCPARTRRSYATCCPRAPSPTCPSTALLPEFADARLAVPRPRRRVPGNVQAVDLARAPPRPRPRRGPADLGVLVAVEQPRRGQGRGGQPRRAGDRRRAARPARPPARRRARPR